MKEEAIIRLYKNADKEDVLNLFRLNTPKYFSAEEEVDLIYYLENMSDNYFVIELKGTIVGSGGYNFPGDKTIGVLSWDILHPNFQGKFLGSRLVKYRIEKLQNFKNLQ